MQEPTNPDSELTIHKIVPPKPDRFAWVIGLIGILAVLLVTLQIGNGIKAQNDYWQNYINQSCTCHEPYSESLGANWKTDDIPFISTQKTPKPETQTKGGPKP